MKSVEQLLGSGRCQLRLWMRDQVIPNRHLAGGHVMRDVSERRTLRLKPATMVNPAGQSMPRSTGRINASAAPTVPDDIFSRRQNSRLGA